MKYTRLETTKVVGVFPTGSVVTVLALNTEVDELLPLTSNIADESQHIQGVFIWDTQLIDELIDTPTSVMLVMSNGNYNVYVKAVLGVATPDDELDNYPAKEDWKAEVDLTTIDAKLDEVPTKVWEVQLP